MGAPRNFSIVSRKVTESNEENAIDAGEADTKKRRTLQSLDEGGLTRKTGMTAHTSSPFRADIFTLSDSLCVLALVIRVMFLNRNTTGTVYGSLRF